MIEPELEEALRFHGISKDKMDYELIKWLGSVKLENPMVYSYIIRDDARVQDYIKQWDFVVSTGITVDYPKRRGWDSFMALREFVQNALDIEDKLFGYENIMVDVNVVEHEHMIKITDRGPGIEFDAFKVGASSKGCADRGYFGEGLKVALAYLVGTGRPVYIFNKRGQVFKPCVVPGSDIVLLVIGRHRTVVPGTMVRIYNWFETEDLSYMVFQTWLKSHAIGKDVIVWRKDTMKPNCQINRPNFIVKNVNNVPVNRLWVRDIYVNELSSILYRSIYGYNLWWISLEPNRRMVASVSDLRSEAAFAFTKEAVYDLLNTVFEITFSGVYMVARVKKEYLDYFEVRGIDWWYSSIDARKAAAEWVESNKLAVTTEENVDWFTYMGVKPLICPREMERLFSEAPTAERALAEIAVERIKSADSTIVSEDALKFGERVNLGLAKLLIEIAHFELLSYEKKMPRIIVSRNTGDAAGMTRGNVIYLNRSVLQFTERACSAAIHEYAHFYGEASYSKAPDISEEFERALTKVSGVIVKALYEDARAVAAFSRAKRGAWNASYRKIPAIDTIASERTAPRTVWTINHYAPAVLAVDARAVMSAEYTENSFIADEDWCLTRFIGRDIVIPSKEAYFDICRKYVFPKLRKIAMDRGWEKAMVYLYDPWNDTYVYDKAYIVSELPVE